MHDIPYSVPYEIDSYCKSLQSIGLLHINININMPKSKTNWI